MFLKLRLSVFLIMQIFIIITFLQVLFIACIKNLFNAKEKIFEHITFFLEPSENFCKAFQDIQKKIYLMANANASDFMRINFILNIIYILTNF